MNRIALAALLVCVVLTSTPAAGPKQPVGVILNSSVEMVDDGNRPVHWTIDPAPPRGTFDGAKVVSGVAHEGTQSLMISTTNYTWLNKTLARPYATYKLKGWIRTEDVPSTDDVGARLEVRGVKVTSPARNISGTTDWTEVQITFDTEGQDSFSIAAGLGRTRGNSSAAGKAWFDDLKLELISARELKPAVTIDAAKTRAPMPDLIYGQFIEHLGRSIYGGIWAEMLEDRKFYSPVDETRRDKVFVPSPWKSVGDADAVTMVNENAFVGEHAPQIHLREGATPAGITQTGLGVVAGKEYEGYVILAGDASAAPIEVSLSWGSSGSERQTIRIDRLSRDYRRYPIKFKAGSSTDLATFAIVGKGTGRFLIGTSSLMPADNVRGMRADTLALLKELNAPIYRWPGGNFVSGYNWKDGIGDRDKRPPRKNPAWTGIEHNDFGIHEYFEFLHEVHAQPFIALNAGLGSVESAVQEVEYVSGGPDTPMGRLRTQNGRREPFFCKYWAIGNEMSGSWQLGNVAIDEFVRRHNAFSQAVLNIDPSVTLVASGEAVRPSSDWDRQLLSGSAQYIHLNSKHFYRQDWHAGGLMTHVRQIGDAIHAIAEAHREYLRTIPETQVRGIRVSLDEWNYWYGPHVFGELGTRYFLRDALGIAEGINEFSRDTDVIALAAYAQTVNVIGAIKTSKTAAVLDSTGQALVMYRRHFGTIPIEISGATEPLDIAAMWTDRKDAITISVINPTYESYNLAFKVQGARLASTGTSWTLSAPDDMDYNDPGKPPVVKFNEQPLTGIENTLRIAPASATIFRIPAK